MNKPKRRLIQIAPVINVRGNRIFRILCNDGTIWSKHDEMNREDWRLIEAVPDGLPETTLSAPAE